MTKCHTLSSLVSVVKEANLLPNFYNLTGEAIVYKVQFTTKHLKVCFQAFFLISNCSIMEPVIHRAVLISPVLSLNRNIY